MSLRLLRSKRSNNSVPSSTEGPYKSQRDAVYKGKSPDSFVIPLPSSNAVTDIIAHDESPPATPIVPVPAIVLAAAVAQPNRPKAKVTNLSLKNSTYNIKEFSSSAQRRPNGNNNKSPSAREEPVTSCINRVVDLIVPTTDDCTGRTQVAQIELTESWTERMPALGPPSTKSAPNNHPTPMTSPTRADEDEEDSAIGTKLSSYARMDGGIRKPSGFSRSVVPSPAAKGTAKKLNKGATDQTGNCEVMCSKCGKMIDADSVGMIKPETLRIESHSSQCFYRPKQEQQAEDEVSTLARATIMMGKLRENIQQSEVLRSTMPPEFLAEVCAICRAGEAIVEANERSICESRERIEQLQRFEVQLDPHDNPTVYLYLERLIFFLKVPPEAIALFR